MVLACSPAGPLRAQAGALHGCFATVAQAAESILGSVTSASRQGYRADALVVDPVLHRAWLRVANCAHPEHPGVLVPLAVDTANAVPVIATVVEVKRASVATPLVPPGQAVEIAFKSDAVQMSLHGRTVAAAHVGDGVEVVLEGSTAVDANPQHMHGRLVAADRVEVRS